MADAQYEFVCTDCGTVVQSDTEVCPQCGASLEDAPSDGGAPPALTAEWAKHIEKQLYDLQQAIPKSDIISQSYWKRTWAILGHVIAANIVLMLSMFLMALLFKACMG